MVMEDEKLSQNMLGFISERREVTNHWTLIVGHYGWTSLLHVEISLFFGNILSFIFWIISSIPCNLEWITSRWFHWQARQETDVGRSVVSALFPWSNINPCPSNRKNFFLEHFISLLQSDCIIHDIQKSLPAIKDNIWRITSLSSSNSRHGWTFQKEIMMMDGWTLLL